MNFEDWLRNHPKRKYLEKTINFLFIQDQFVLIIFMLKEW